MTKPMGRLHYVWYDRRYLAKRKWEAVVRWIAWHLPRTLVMWCYFRVAAHATTGRFGSTVVPELSMMDAIQRWDEPNER
jgi:hypothetical protein